MATMSEMEKIKLILRKNMEELMEINGLTAPELAEASNLSVQMIRDVKAGRRWPSAATIEAIAKGLGVAVGVLYSENINSEIGKIEAERSLEALAKAMGFEISKKNLPE
jgi:transcriptional regulator with XRE-family HTH domain